MIDRLIEIIRSWGMEWKWKI